MQLYNSCIIIYSVGVCAKNKCAIETLSAVCFGSVLLLPRHHYFSTCVVLAICKEKKKDEMKEEETSYRSEDQKHGK